MSKQARVTNTSKVIPADRESSTIRKAPRADVLGASLASAPSRWSAHTIVAARELLALGGRAATLSRRQWFDLLDEMEAVLAPVAALVAACAEGE